MRKIVWSISWMTLLLLVSGEATAQQWEVTIRILENGLLTDSLTLGINNIGSDSINHALGEAGLPPLPPFGVFDARFTSIPGALGTKKDIRKADIGENVHIMEFVRSSFSSTVSLEWDALPAGSFTLRDNLGGGLGGTLANVDMTTTNSYAIPFTTLNEFRVLVTPEYFPPNILQKKLADAVIGVPYNDVVEIQDPESGGNYTFTLLSGPSWMSVNEAGMASGIPTGDEATGLPVSIAVTDIRGLSDILVTSIDVKEDTETDVEQDESGVVPQEFTLHQNYPNPFNPETSISFSLHVSDFVTLKVYSVAGREVVVLANHRFVSGFHTMKWNGKNDRGQAVTSGVYIYALTTGKGIRSTKRMVLIR